MLPGVKGASDELRVAWHVMWVALPAEPLPVVEAEIVYRAQPAGGLLAERWIPSTPKPAANDPDADPAAPKDPKDAKPAPKAETIWKSSASERATAIIMAGDALFVGFKDRVAALKVSDGKELWSAAIPGHTVDLAFQNGRLFVVTAAGQLICFVR